MTSRKISPGVCTSLVVPFTRVSPTHRPRWSFVHRADTCLANVTYRILGHSSRPLGDCGSVQLGARERQVADRDACHFHRAHIYVAFRAEGKEGIETSHLAEALQYRPRAVG